MNQIRRSANKNKIISGLELSIIGLALLIAISIFAFLQSDYFAISEIIITGNKLVSNEQLISQSQIVRGMNIFRVNIEKTSRTLSEHSRLKDVKVTRILPSTISIEVEERNAVALIPYSSQFIEVDGEGYVLAKGNQISSFNLPIITGLEINQDEINGKLADIDLNQILNAFSMLNPNELKEISEINVSIEEGLLLYTIDGMQVRLGRTENLTGKIRFFLSILSEIRANNIRPGYYIDVSERGYSVIKM